MLLLIDILKHRPKGTSEPVPVWLTLGSWNPDTTPLPDWATTTLIRDYPGVATAYGGPGTAAELIRTGRVALFLDGLDEMPPPLQGRALEVIDRDGVGLRLVLTSRPSEYASAVEDGRLWAPPPSTSSQSTSTTPRTSCSPNNSATPVTPGNR